MSLPAASRRLFAHLADGTEPSENEVIERLLENGDRADLAWLTRRVPEERLASWLRARGTRRLSDRSRAFWSLVLGEPLEDRPEISRELWPL